MLQNETLRQFTGEVKSYAKQYVSPDTENTLKKNTLKIVFLNEKLM